MNLPRQAFRGLPAVAGLVLLLLPWLVAAEEKSVTDKGLSLFREQVRPLLESKCLSCHGGEKQRGGLDLSQRVRAMAGGENGPALTPGKPDASLLLRKLSAGEMPPRNPLSAEQVAGFRKWIEAGAPFENEPLTAAIKRAGADWWSLQAVRRPLVPVTKRADWIRTPIDAFIRVKLEEQGLEPAPEADRSTLIRRVTFDLLGLPPSPEEVAAFVSDPAPDAYERLIDRLLASPHYGERWGRHWLDVVRFAESHGYETNNLRMTAWPYRDYVIRAFNEDTPYPRFIRDQLAGDTVKEGDWLVQSATGFLVGGAHDVVGNQTEDGRLQQRLDDLDDLVTATGATFLGLTTNCARCHDHKFDPISQRDYYGLQAIFAGVQHAEREVRVEANPRRLEEAARAQAELARRERDLDAIESPRGKSKQLPVNARRNVERFDAVEVRFIRFTALATNSKIQPCLDELEVFTAEESPRNVALASAGAKATASSTLPNNAIHKLEHVNDGRYGNERSWISNEKGSGWVQIELPRPERIDRIVWGRDRNERYQDRLAIEYRIEVAPEPGQWQVVAASADRLPFQANGPVADSLTAEQRRQRDELRAQVAVLRRQAAERGPALNLYVGKFTSPGPTHVLERGDPLRRAEVVPPGALAVIRPALTLDANTPESDRRLALARWLAHPDNPLPARVMVNRIWHYHFGQGIVTTPSDFGYGGDRPSHPELLDWLASEFVQNGWRLKPLHRLILLSSTYRQGGRLDARAQAMDRHNRLLWRMSPRRLEAESLRDNLLSVSGRLDRRMGGPGYNLWEKNTNYVVVFRPKTDLGPDEFRRMIYQFKPRTQQDPTFGVFDCPDAALARPKRTVSTTVLQALNLLNGRLVLQQSEEFAERLRREAGDNPAQQAERAFRLAFGRAPTSTETAAAVELIRGHGLPALCRAIVNANEFLYVD